MSHEEITSNCFQQTNENSMQRKHPHPPPKPSPYAPEHLNPLRPACLNNLGEHAHCQQRICKKSKRKEIPRLKKPQNAMEMYKKKAQNWDAHVIESLDQLFKGFSVCLSFIK